MSLLLDTHVVLWWLTDDPTLDSEIRIGLTTIRTSMSAQCPSGK
jgi:PIN domain nuclease of toxin-antitoxin system